MAGAAAADTTTTEPTTAPEQTGEFEPKTGEQAPPEPPPVDELERQRIEIRRRTSTLKKRERELEQRAQQFAEREKSLAEVDELRKLKDEDPFGFLQKLGVDPRDLVARSYEQAQKVADPALAKVQELEQRLAEQEQQRLEAEAAAARAQDLSVLDSAIGRLQPELPALFAFIEDGEYTKQDVLEFAYQEIVDHHAKTGVVLDVSEVLRTYDRQLLEASEKAANRYARIRPPPPAPAAAPAPAPIPGGKPRASATLSNRDVAAAAPEQKPSSREELVKSIAEDLRRMKRG